MATLTIRDLDDTLKQSLRVRAAHRNHSMEEEARQILRAALLEQPSAEKAGLVERVRARFAAFGDIDLPAPSREPARTPPRLGGRSQGAPARPSKTGASRARK